jgi:hypothetical protein
MIRSRDALAETVQTGRWRQQWDGVKWRSSFPKVGDDGKRLWHWEPHIRAALYDQELLGQLRFTLHGNKLELRSVLGKTPPLIAALVCPPRETFETQLDLVQSWATRREERLSEVLSQTVPQVPFWAAVLQLNPNRHRCTFELVEATLRLTMVLVMRFKHEFACPRPSEYSPNIQPMIQVPGYSAYPSGHATESSMVAHLLLALTGQNDSSPLKTQMLELADRIAGHRVTAGLHFPIDSAAGFYLGRALAGYLAALGSSGSKWKGVVFDGAAYPPNADWRQSTPPPAQGGPYLTEMKPTASPAGAAPTFAQLWERARNEQREAGFAA